MGKNRKKNKKTKGVHYHFEGAKIVDVEEFKKSVREILKKKEV